MRNLPNIITLVRLGLVPVMGYYAVREEYAIALPIFLVAALSDFVDGYLAREWRIVSRFGAVLDPVADKLNMFVATLLLAWQGLIPIWLAAAIISRDIIIVTGVLAYRILRGHLDIEPTRLSKANTFLEFGVLLVVMAIAAGWIDARTWMPPLFAVLFVTVVASGLQYVWIGTRMALAQRKKR